MTYHTLLKWPVLLSLILISFTLAAQHQPTEPLARPDSVTAALGNNNVEVKWRFNTIHSVDGFKIQRSINGTNVYATIATVGADVRSFTDAGYVNNSLNQYRISSFRDSLSSYYSEVASVALGNAPFAMTNGTFTKCGVTFFDPGGQGSYGNGRYTTTIRPATTDGKVRISFSEFELSYGDYLNIYNGPSANSPLLGLFTSTTLPPVLESTAPGGELTFVFNPIYAYYTPGWKAFLTCYRPLAAPNQLTVRADSLNLVQLTWKDNANDETGYQVERSLDDSLHFMPLASLPVNVNSYRDTSAINSDLRYYRVRALRDSANSDYSKIAVALSGEVYSMQNGTVTTCNLTFLNPGASGNYNAGYYTTTMRPGIQGNSLKAVFKEFNVTNAGYLSIYDGPSTSSPQLGTFYNTSKPPVLHSTAPGGELTFVFSGYSSYQPGWFASITCYTSINMPTGLSAKWENENGIQLSWIDNANDETGYTIERSVNDSFYFSKLVTLPANSTNYRDTSAPENGFVFYRVKAFRDSVSSRYSVSASAINGNTHVMQNGTVNLCNATFLDPAGLGNYSRGNYTTTISPSIIGNSLQVNFKQFNLVSGDNLAIYNGPSTSSPLLGRYAGWDARPTTLKSTAPGGELTFVFSAYSSEGYSGWMADLTCFKPVLRPTGVIAAKENTQHIQLSWTDNADDETSYVIERSVNAESLFKPIGQVAVNQTFFTDSTPPVNSQLYYRLKAYRDTASSLYSDAVAIALGNAPFIMKDSVLVTCDKIFMDPGGEDVMQPYTSYNYKTTFKPGVPGSRVRVTFTKVKMNSFLYVGNGSSTESPFIGSVSSYNSNSQMTFEGTGPEGSLTFSFNSDTYSNRDSGWVAQVSCYKPVTSPTEVRSFINGSEKVEVVWNDHSDDETGFVVERSVNAQSKFEVVGETGANATSYIDNTAPTNSTIYYRIKAIRDTASSYYSNTAKVDFGNAPFLLADSTLSTCDKVFMDPGGKDRTRYGYYNHTVTFKPGINGNNIKVAFSEFKTDGTLYIYNGSSTSSPLIGNYSYYSGSPGIINGTGPEGSLTFVFQGYPDSGWTAQVSCYKPVAKPTGLVAIENESKAVKVTWSDNADNETKYVIERAVNERSNFRVIGEVAESTTVFIDSSAEKGSFLYYRIRGYRDTLPSFYSDTAALVLGDSPFEMKDSTIITCDKIFMDPGGVDMIPSNNGNYHSIKTTFRAGINGYNIKAVFSKFHLNGSLYVYDGPSRNSPLIGYYSNYTARPGIFTATGPDGTLTFVYEGWAYNDTGWIAQISCYKPVAKPTGLKATANSLQKVQLSWTDNANDETMYVVERSVNASSRYETLAQLPVNTNEYTDTSAPAGKALLYRVRAYRDTIGSVYSDTADIAIGDAPLLMTRGTVTTCDKVFLDPGGEDIIIRKYDDYFYTTFKPAISGNKIRVVFSKFRLGGTLYVHNGSSTASPVIGSFGGQYENSLVINSTAEDGSLTFQLSAYENGDSGWVAHVSCYKPVATPSGLKAVQNDAQKIELTWADNADDETRYVVERSVNAFSLFKPLVQLPANATQFIDIAPPPNSYIYYRVRAYRDTLTSLLSDTASVAFGNTPFFMKDSTVITCNKVFMDPGGADAVSLNFSKFTTTFKPSVSGNKMKVAFSKMSFRNSLYIYDGSSANSPLIASFGAYSNSNLSSPFVYKATNEEGTLTIVYQNYLFTDSGWVAQVTCYKPVAAPGNLTIDKNEQDSPRLTWNDNANNETGFIIERSITDSFHYQPIIRLAANTTSYIDTAAPVNGFLYYRVLAYIDTSNSDFSNAVSIVTGTPFVMHDTAITTCGTVFLDPGGFGNYGSGYYTTTIKPAIPGNVVRVKFTDFQIDGTLSVYNGPSVTSPLIGEYYNWRQPTFMESTAPGGELTFVFNGYNSYYYPGWISYASCFKPVSTPTELRAVSDPAANSITWIDNADDETKYVVERSVNAPSLFVPLSELPSNSVQYTDNSAPANSVSYYRIRAFRDTAASSYSDIVSVAVGDAPFLMKDSTLITCDKIFMDAGGEDKIPLNTTYGINTVATFKPAVPGNKILVAFKKIHLGGYLYVYNGPSTSSPELASLNYYSDPSSVFRSTAPDGSLTFLYRRASDNDSGWVAQISCYKPVAKPSGLTAITNSTLKVNLAWADNADDETSYIVERSVNGSSNYTQVAQLPANTALYADSTAPVNNLLYYRVRALRDTLSSFYSDTAYVAVGNAPFLMKDSTVITCDKIFMDPAGEDAMLNSEANLQATFKPAVAGNKIRVSFSKFRLNGYLYVYNGPTTESPMLGSFSSYYSHPPVLNSTAPDGSMTFRLSTSSYYRDSGWVAQVSCYKPVARPSGLNAVADNVDNIRLTWKDNADNETKYVVERSVNAPSQFQIIAQLPINSTEYLDTTAPANSLVYYRLRAYQDSLIYVYSDTASIAKGEAPFLMTDSTLITCNKVFMDAGGTGLNTPRNYRTITTFKPGISGKKIQVSFDQLKIDGTLYVYNGPTSNSPLLATIDSYYPNRTPVFTATGVDGSLTFVYQNSYNYYADSGWVARVSCYKAVAPPSGLQAEADSAAIVKLNWTDQADDETRYVIERSINTPSRYTPVAHLPANSTEYFDTTKLLNSLLYYRVKAYRDTASSLYSDTATAAIGNAPFLMKDSTLITCEKVFMDPGGVGITQGYQMVRATFKPATPGLSIQVNFSKIGANSNLYVYNGAGTSSTFIGPVSSTSNRVVYSTAPDGSLTFVYQNYSYYGDSGWIAQVSCFEPVKAAGDLVASANEGNDVSLNWSDQASDESRYVVERSFNNSFNFAPLVTMPANTTSYTDTSAPANSFVFYRVRAYRDAVPSAYSNTASVLNGSVFSMRSGTIKACGVTFLDPGGEGNYGNNIRYTTTFTSPEKGKKVRVSFNSFATENCCDFLNVYNGPDTLSPLIGTFLASTIPSVLESTARDGELTFVFVSDRSTTAPGWSASVSCIQQADTIAICSSDTNLVVTISSNIQGASYQWQKYNGSSFVNIQNDHTVSGTASPALLVRNINLEIDQKYRCVVDQETSKEVVLLKANRWTGTVSKDWNDPANWSCGTVPDANTNVLIESDKQNYPVLNTNAECRSIKLTTGSTLHISPGFNLHVYH